MFENVAEAIAWIHGEGSARKPSKKSGLDNMRAIMSRLGDPQNKLKMIHVAGTNGKGSVCAYTEMCLRRAGYTTGLYTSPYLCRYNERVRLNGVSIPDDELMRIASRIYEVTESLAQDGIYATTFEIGTAIAFVYFAEKNVDAAVIEVGIGGRLDSTNIITPCLSLICSIGFDHMSVLGNTLGSIASEKAGIIKPGVPCAVYPVKDEALGVIRSIAAERGSMLLESGSLPTEIRRLDSHSSAITLTLGDMGPVDIEIPLVGAHQINNARLAAAGLMLLRESFPHIDARAIKEGIAATRWPGRLEWIDSRTLIDGAHNPEGAQSLADYVKTLPGRRVLVTGMMKDKQIEACAYILAGAFDTIIATRVDYPRAASCAEIADVYRAHGAECTEAATIEEAISLAREAAGDGITVIAGSLYVAGEARMILTGGEEL